MHWDWRLIVPCKAISNAPHVRPVRRTLLPKTECSFPQGEEAGHFVDAFVCLSPTSTGVTDRTPSVPPAKWFLDTYPHGRYVGKPKMVPDQILPTGARIPWLFVRRLSCSIDFPDLYNLLSPWDFFTPEPPSPSSIPPLAESSSLVHI